MMFPPIAGRMGERNRATKILGWDRVVKAMTFYNVAEILTQDVPEEVLMDMAFHFQANDNWEPSVRISSSRYIDSSSRLAIKHIPSDRD
jgi:hypothetical protein